MDKETKLDPKSQAANDILSDLREKIIQAAGRIDDLVRGDADDKIVIRQAKVWDIYGEKLRIKVLDLADSVSVLQQEIAYISHQRGNDKALFLEVNLEDLQSAGFGYDPEKKAVWNTNLSFPVVGDNLDKLNSTHYVYMDARYEKKLISPKNRFMVRYCHVVQAPPIHEISHEED